MINIAGILTDSIVDGEGYRMVIFEQGCLHNCKGCHNPDTHEFCKKQHYSIKQLLNIISQNTLIDGITLSGGDPFFQAKGNIDLINGIKQLELDIDIWAYTGFTWEQFYDFDTANKKETNIPIITHDMIEMLKLCDILVDGKFNEELKSLSSNYIGSTNQRIINIKESLGNRKPIVLNY